MISCFILITQGSQNVSEEKANHQEDVAGEGISAPERQRREQAKGVRGHAPPWNFENHFLQNSLFLLS